ncbi:ion transporter [Candidatus Dojkabacteria bacterium]|nr:ion transporter [Candidatus Dojkabacteria bacterium]
MNEIMKKVSFNRQITDRIKHSFAWISITVVISLSITFIVFAVERDVNIQFDSFGEMFWWWIVTISGLGYGDVYPVTVEGKILGALVIASGLVLLAIVISEVADLIRITYDRREKGIIRIGYSNHVVIYGYTSLTAGVVKLLREHFGKHLKIVLISNDTDFNPFPKEVDFIYANPIDKETFVEANASEALASIILANDRFTDPDAYSLVIATGVERHNANAVTIVEVMDDSYKALYKEGKIEAFIKRKELLQDLLSHSKDSKFVRIIEKETPLQFVQEQIQTEVV